MTLATERAGILAALADYDAAQVFGYAPESLVAPAIILHPADPFLDDDGQPFGSYTITWLVSIVTKVATNERMTTELDAHIEAVVARLNVATVSAPYQFAYNGANYLAANARVTGTLKIGE